MRLLQHIAQMRLQPENAARPVIRAVDQYFALGRLVEPADEVHDRGFAAAGFAHERHGLPGLDGQREIVEHLLAALIMEGNMIEFDIALQTGPVFLLRVKAVAELFNDLR